MGTVDVFVFRDGFAGRGADTHVCVADAKQSDPFISKDEIDRTFFGYVLFGQPLGKSYVGVWGARNASRFRRLLRERGADVEIKQSAPPARLTRWVDHGAGRAKARKGG